MIDELTIDECMMVTAALFIVHCIYILPNSTHAYDIRQTSKEIYFECRLSFVFLLEIEIEIC